MNIYRHILILCGLITSSLLTTAQSDEYLMKAVFLEKFARFSEWPTTIDTFQIAVLGESPINGRLKYVYSTVKIKNKPVKIHYINSIGELQNPQILFISSSEKKEISDILERTSTQPVLTISEASGLCEKGVILNFYTTTEGTIHFEINQNALKNSGIEMDVYLLEYAKLIN